MAPTRIYVKSLLPLVRAGKIHALAHITGGGLLENIPRVLPEGTHAVVDADGWEQPRLMAFLQAQGNIEPEEMARSEEHTSELQSLMRISYAVFCLKKKNTTYNLNLTPCHSLLSTYSTTIITFT